MAVKLFRCKICGDPYIGESPPTRCPFCGAYQKFIVIAKEFNETFDIKLGSKEKKNAQMALQREVSNASFYFCAAEKTGDEEGKQLFRALAKVETEHAVIWGKLLKLPKGNVPKSGSCSTSNKANLKESHTRETATISFYKQALGETANLRMKQILSALIEIETDHLRLSEEWLKRNPS